MKKLKQLLEDRADKLNKFEALTEAAKGRELSEEETSQLVTLNDELEVMEKEIKSLQAIEARSKQIAQAKAVGAPQDDASEVKELARFSYGRAVKSISKNNFKGSVEGFEKEMAEEAIKECREAGVEVPQGQLLIPSRLINYGRNDNQRLLDVNTEGADLVRTEYRPMIPALRIPLIADQFGVTKYNGLKGNVKIPRETNEATFVWETENSAADEFTLTFDSIDLSPKRLAGYTDISGQMLVQSPEITEQYLRERIQYGIGAALDAALVNGASGGNSPIGILNFPGVNVVSLGSSGGDITYGALVALIASVMNDNARDGKSGFVMNSNGFASLALTPMQASGTEGNFILKPGDSTIWGHPFRVTNRIPSDLTETTTGLSGLIYSSNWSSAILATWGGVGILFDPYTQALTNKLRIVVNTYADIDIEHPEEFAVIKDWITTLPALT
jgi:HK97 family phage major capsid protein